MGVTPFSSATADGVVERIIQHQVAVPSHMASAAKDFILQALSWEPRHRPTLIQMMAHAWVSPSAAAVPAWAAAAAAGPVGSAGFSTGAGSSSASSGAAADGASSSGGGGGAAAGAYRAAATAGAVAGGAGL